ncbi:MAG: DUF2268 domain-containing putative Zn-dependent protease, partial [Sedimentisphaerales bacterium]|nr:DUF2268 domain-containing putative Zn-dependent protease [Sedimentisphaerales bacterium]
MNPNNNNDRYFYADDMPPQASLRIEKAIWRGIHSVRLQTGLNKAVSVRVCLFKKLDKNPLSIPGHFLSYGNTTKYNITIWIFPKLLASRNFFRMTAGTGIHEYVHYLRYQFCVLQGSTTVLEQAIEEGIAIYVQTTLSQAPNYLGLRTLNEHMVRICWDKLSAALNDPLGKHPTILRTQVYREVYYRIGFGIVRRFMDEHPRISLAGLIKMRRQRLKQFAV